MGMDASTASTTIERRIVFMEPSDLGERGRIRPPNPKGMRKGCTGGEGLSGWDLGAPGGGGRRPPPPPNPKGMRKGCTGDEGLNRCDLEARGDAGHCRLLGGASFS